MTMRPAGDTSAADWIVRADPPWYVVATYGPPGLAEYARIDFASDDEYSAKAIEPLVWADPDRVRWESILNLLAKFTTTPNQVHLGLWDGTGSYRTRGPYFGNAGRQYALMSGTLAGALDRTLLSDDHAPNAYNVPHLTWPQDQAWCIARDTDEEHRFSVGGTSEAMSAVLAMDGLRGSIVPYGTPEAGWTW